MENDGITIERIQDSPGKFLKRDSVYDREPIFCSKTMGDVRDEDFGWRCRQVGKFEYFISEWPKSF